MKDKAILPYSRTSSASRKRKPKTTALTNSETLFKYPWATGMRITVDDLQFLLSVAKGLKRPMNADMLMELLANRKFNP